MQAGRRSPGCGEGVCVLPGEREARTKEAREQGEREKKKKKKKKKKKEGKRKRVAVGARCG